MRRERWLHALLFVGTFLIYLPVYRHEFVNYDDYAYVTFNYMVQQGLTWPGIQWAFGHLHGEVTYWHPITWISHMIDSQLFGLKPAGHHLMNVLFHSLNVALLFSLLRGMTGMVGRSAIVAALFALHPLQVDSVAWVAERKNVLSTMFWLLTLVTYVAYARRRSRTYENGRSKIQDPRSREDPRSKTRSSKSQRSSSQQDPNPPIERTLNPQPSTLNFQSSTLNPFCFYALALVFFALGLMSKPMLVTVPCVMLLLDFWPLGRLPASRITHHASRITHHVSRLLLEKVPFFALSIASSLVTIRAHQALGGLVSTEALPVPLRIANAAVAYVIYLRKIVWPADLSVFYMHPGRWPAGIVFGCALVLVFITAIAIRRIRRQPYLVVGWLWFLGTLVPTIGLVQADVQALADRFAYVPVIGVFIMLVWTAADVVVHWPQMQRLGVSFAALGACAVMTSLQLRHWQNSVTLVQRAVTVDAKNPEARVMLGNALFERGRFTEAFVEYQEAVRLRPGDPNAWQRAGVALSEQGKPAEAIPYFNRAIQLAPPWPEPRRRLALALVMQGRTGEAQAVYQTLVPLMPPTPEGQRDLADMLAEGKQYADAVQHYREALKLQPDFLPVLNNLALLLATCPKDELRDGKEAVRLAERACELSQRRNPNFLGTLAAAYAGAGRFVDAIRVIEEAQGIARSSGTTNLLQLHSQMLEQFRAGKPYREPSG